MHATDGTGRTRRTPQRPGSVERPGSVRRRTCDGPRLCLGRRSVAYECPAGFSRSGSGSWSRHWRARPRHGASDGGDDSIDLDPTSTPDSRPGTARRRNVARLLQSLGTNIRTPSPGSSSRRRTATLQPHSRGDRLLLPSRLRILAMTRWCGAWSMLWASNCGASNAPVPTCVAARTGSRSGAMSPCRCVTARRCSPTSSCHRMEGRCPWWCVSALMGVPSASVISSPREALLLLGQIDGRPPGSRTIRPARRWRPTPVRTSVGRRVPRGAMRRPPYVSTSAATGAAEVPYDFSRSGPSTTTTSSSGWRPRGGARAPWALLPCRTGRPSSGMWPGFARRAAPCHDPVGGGRRLVP